MHKEQRGLSPIAGTRCLALYGFAKSAANDALVRSVCVRSTVRVKPAPTCRHEGPNRGTGLMFAVPSWGTDPRIPGTRGLAPYCGNATRGLAPYCRGNWPPIAGTRGVWPSTAVCWSFSLSPTMRSPIAHLAARILRRCSSRPAALEAGGFGFPLFLGCALIQ